MISDIPIGIVRASTMILLIVSPINFGLNVGLVHYTRLRILGAPIAVSLTFWLSFLLLAIYTFFSPAHKSNQTWRGLQLRNVLNLKGCMAFLKLAIPGVLMVGTEWYSLILIAY
jgi:multidrug resistance protein, MATE family